MQPLQNTVDYNKEKVQPSGQAQTQTKEQPVPERSFKDKAIDTGLNLGIDALDGTGEVLSNAFTGGMADMGIKGMQTLGQKLPFLKKIPGAARVAPYLMRDPRLAAIAGTGTAAYLGTNYLMDKSGAADGVANMIVGNKDYSQAGNLTEEQQKLMDQGFNPYKPIYNEHVRGPQYTDRSPSNIKGYERTPGFDAHIAAGGTEENYADRNADMNKPAPANTNQATPMLDNVMQNGVGPFQPGAIDIGANQPNLAAVQPPAQAQATQPNLQAVQPAPSAQVPQVPQYGDLTGTYKTQDGRNVGIFEGMSMRNEDGDLRYVSDEQVAAMQDRMDAQGAPVISGEREGNLTAFIDNMGNVQYGDQQTANGMNQIEAEYQKEDRAAHQRFLQSDAAKAMTARSLSNARADVAAQNAASQARVDRMNARPDFMEARPDVTNSADGLTDSQRRKIFPNPADRARSKAGLNQDGGSIADDRAQAQAKIAETNARIAALKERDPSKYEANVETVDGIMQGPQFKDLDPKQAAQVRTLLLLQLSGMGTDETMGEFDDIVFPAPAPPPPPPGEETEGSDSE